MTLLKATMRGELKFIGAVTVPAPPSMDPRGDDIYMESGGYLFICIIVLSVNESILTGTIR